MSIPTIIDTLCEISGQLHGIHASIKRQTELLVMMKNQSSANESANKAKEAAPAPKGITWQEAVKTMRAFCMANPMCVHCPAYEWCKKALIGAEKTPNVWEVPGDE